MKKLPISKTPAWSNFERRVADIFRLYGFFPSLNTIVAGRQIDILLTSSEEFVGPIVVECKYHDPSPGSNVGVEEVEAFAALVLRLRSSGTASAGYLVTNTAFTASARGALQDRPEGKFVFLRTIDELLSRIVRFDRYLMHAIEQFEHDPLYHVYEPVSVRKLVDQQPQPFDDVIDSFLAADNMPTMLMLGDYGTGKTSSCRHLFHRLAVSVLKTQSGRIPLYIPLKTYNFTGTAESLVNKFLVDSLALSRPTFEVFDALNRAGLLFLILDGFDEMARRVTRRVRNEAFRSLGALIHKNSKVLISGRPAYFPMHAELLNAVTLLHSPSTLDQLSGQLSKDLNSDYAMSISTVEPLSDDQVDSFLIKRLKHSGLAESTVMQKANAIISTIRKVYNLNELARRPILLEMIFRTIDRLGSKKVKTATDLYKIYTDAWLKIDTEKGDFRTLLSTEDRVIFTLKLAWSLLITQKEDIHYDEITALVKQHFELDEVEDVDHFSSDVRTCSFLERTDDGRYSFAHKSFLEFFGARALAVQLGIERVDSDFENADRITLGELEEWMPNLFAFLDDFVGTPLAPSYWAAIYIQLDTYPELMMESGPDADQWLDIAEELSGETFADELADSLDVIRDVHRGLVAAVNAGPARFPRLTEVIRGSYTIVEQVGEGQIRTRGSKTVVAKRAGAKE